jgi:predicted dehydrogenase
MGLKVAIVGCGKIADGHVEEIAKSDLASVVAVCDREPLMAEQLAVRYGISGHFDSVERMLDAHSPDVVHITTPPQSHRELAVTAIEAGCHVLVEKPLAPDAAEAGAIVKEAAERGRHLTVGYTYLFDPPALALRRLVENGVIGEPVHVESFYGYNLENVFGQAVTGNDRHWVRGLPGTLLQNNIDHLLNKIAEFVVDPHPDIRAIAYRGGSTAGGLNDELRVMIKGNEVSAYGTLSCHARPVGHFLRVYGSKNTAHVDFVSRTVTLDPAPGLPSAIGRVLPAFTQSWRYFREGSKNTFKFVRSDFHFFSGLNRLFELFYRSILDGTDPPISYDTILRVARMTDEIIGQVNNSEAGDSN